MRSIWKSEKITMTAKQEPKVVKIKMPAEIKVALASMAAEGRRPLSTEILIALERYVGRRVKAPKEAN